MKKIALVIIPILLFVLGLFAFSGTKNVDAAKGDRASYKLDPWTFWQSGVSTDGWNSWELSAYKYVILPDDSDKFSDSTVGDNFYPRIYGAYKGEYSDNLPINNHFFDHEKEGTRPKNDEKEVTVHGVAHGFIASIEKNGWSGKWVPTDEELAPSDDPPKWGEPETTQGETTSFTPYLMDNNPYTVRCWTTARGLKKNRSYTWKFDAYIDEGAYMAKLGGNEPVDNKYCKIVGTTESGTILFVRYMSFTTKKQTFMFNFDMDSNNSAIKVEMMYGAFLKTGPIIKHEEVVWTGNIHIENCDILQGNMNATEEVTTTRRQGGGGGGGWEWEDETELPKPAKVKGVKAKVKAKKSVTLSWKKASRAKKYQINYALKKNFKGAKSKKTKKLKLVFKGLKKKKTYFFRVRGINSSGKGKWSATKKVKFK